MVDKPGAVVITLNLSLYYDEMISKCYYWNIGDTINPILIRISEQGGNGKPNEDQGPNEGDNPGGDELGHYHPHKHCCSCAHCVTQTAS